MKFRPFLILLLASACVASFATLLPVHPTSSAAEPVQVETKASDFPRRCVGISTALIKSNPAVIRVYRAFDDGSVEIFDDGASAPSPTGAKWAKLGT